MADDVLLYDVEADCCVCSMCASCLRPAPVYSEMSFAACHLGRLTQGSGNIFLACKGGHTGNDAGLQCVCCSCTLLWY